MSTAPLESKDGLIRVFPRKTKATPDDALAFTGSPTKAFLESLDKDICGNNSDDGATAILLQHAKEREKSTFPRRSHTIFPMQNNLRRIGIRQGSP